jgi:hypothetical protein
VKPSDLLSLLQGIHADKLALVRRHEAGAQQVAGYAFNNTYQYILNREHEHLSWLRSAIEDAGAEPSAAAEPIPVPPSTGGAAPGTVMADDARTAQAFVDKWAPRLGEVAHARHRKMLDLLLGETREQQRFFEQAAAGREELLGRRPAGAGTGGGVLPTRWRE